jgi:hypothetical protein
MAFYERKEKKHYCGKYKGIDVWQYGMMIGSGWYGDFYVTVPRGKSRRDMKVNDSVCRSLEVLKDYVNRHLDELKAMCQ